MVRRFLIFLLAMILLLGMVACSGSGQKPPVDDPSNDAEAPPSDEKEDPTPDDQEPDNEGGEELPPPPPGFVFTEETVIVCSSVYDEYVERAVTLLQYEIKQATGLSLSIASDKTVPTEKEIIVGFCDRLDPDGTSAPAFLQDGDLIFALKDTAELYCLVRVFVEKYLSSDAVNVTEEMLAQLAAEPTAYDSRIRILTQNLRYANDADGNSVAERSARFAALMQAYMPDIVGTQEATPLWTQYLEEHFSDEYERVGVFRDGTGHSGDEANYILFRKDRFSLEESGTFWLTDEPKEIGKVEGALCNRICTWALLKDLQTGEKIFVCNTHLDHSNDDIRSAQLKVLLDYIALDIKSYPVLMTGDFNALRTSAPYKSIQKAGLYDGEKKAWLSDSDVNHTCHLYRGWGETIDYCFYNKFWTPIYARIVSDDYGGYVSDHYGVVVDFVRFGS